MHDKSIMTWAGVAAVVLVACSCLMRAQATASTVLACPDSIPVTSFTLHSLPAGWTPYMDGALFLSAASPIDGAPDRRRQLVPSAERKSEGTTVLSYRLEGRYPDGKWLQCSYGAHGEVSLSKKLDDGVSFCAFTYKKGRKAGQNEIRIDCR